MTIVTVMIKMTCIILYDEDLISDEQVRQLLNAPDEEDWCFCLNHSVMLY